MASRSISAAKKRSGRSVSCSFAKGWVLGQQREHVLVDGLDGLAAALRGDRQHRRIRELVAPALQDLLGRAQPRAPLGRLGRVPLVAARGVRVEQVDLVEQHEQRGGRGARRRSSCSSGNFSWKTSTTSSRTSASTSELRTNAIIPSCSRYCGCSITPGVSDQMIWWSSPLSMPKMRWRVVCAFEVAIKALAEQRVKSVDLPTLGTPTMLTKPARWMGVAEGAGVAESARRRFRSGL